MGGGIFKGILNVEVIEMGNMMSLYINGKFVNKESPVEVTEGDILMVHPGLNRQYVIVDGETINLSCYSKEIYTIDKHVPTIVFGGSGTSCP